MHHLFAPCLFCKNEKNYRTLWVFLSIQESVLSTLHDTWQGLKQWWPLSLVHNDNNQRSNLTNIRSPIFWPLLFFFFLIYSLILCSIFLLGKVILHFLVFLDNLASFFIQGAHRYFSYCSCSRGQPYMIRPKLPVLTLSCSLLGTPLLKKMIQL